MLTSLLVTLAVAFSLALVLLLVPALLVQRLLAGADEQEDWVDLFPESTPIGFDVDGFGVRRLSA